MDQVGPYPVERRLGGGSFATVWLVRDERLDALMAAKVLADNWSHDEDVKRRFLDEARILWRLNDDRIVRVHTVGELPDGRPYFVMDHADRGSLEDRIAERKAEGRAFPLDDAIDVSLAIADALVVAHAHGIVHRDLKPSNVLYRTVSEGRRRRVGAGSAAEEVVLGDFGIARRLEGATNRTISAGTPHYMAPEQASLDTSGATDARADIYSAAVILYELLAGTVPYPQDSMGAVLMAQREGKPPPLREVRPEVTPALEQVVSRGMAPDPEQRHATAEEWRDALVATRAQPGGTVIERPAPPPPPTAAGGGGRPPRRRLLIVAAAIAVLALAGAAALFLTRDSTPPGGPGGLTSPVGIAVDPQGNVYVADSSRYQIKKVAADGRITTVAGTGTSESSGDGGPAERAAIESPEGLAFADGNLYVLTYDRIRSIGPDGRITTAIAVDEQDRGQLGDVSMTGLAADATGLSMSAGTKIIKATADGRFSVIAGADIPGFGGDGGPATAARLNGVDDVVADADGNLYLTDSGNHRIRRIDTEGTITTVIGSGSEGFFGDGGPALEAGLADPSGVAVGADGTVYVADSGNLRIRKVSPDGRITTLAGTGEYGTTPDGTPALSAAFSHPTRMTVDQAGNLYVIDASASRVYRIDTAGVVTSLA